MKPPTKLGTVVRLKNGELATVVYNGLLGVGVKFGVHKPDPKDFVSTSGDFRGDDEVPDDWPWYPDAILRNPWSSCEKSGWTKDQCVGEPESVYAYPEDVSE